MRKEEPKLSAQDLKEEIEKTPAEIKQEEEEVLNTALEVDILELRLGYELIRLADPKEGGTLFDYVRSQRKRIASEYGFIVPPIRITDDMQVGTNNYEIMLKRSTVGKGTIYPDKMLAMDTGMVIDHNIKGIEVKEPVFGLDAMWIDKDLSDEATMNGYTVIDPGAVIITHISEVIKEYAKDFITRDEVKKIIDRISAKYPTLAEAASAISPNVIKGVLQELLEDKIPISDMATILETITDVAPLVNNDINIIVEHTRANLARTITNLYKSDSGVLKAVILDNATENLLLNNISNNDLILPIEKMQELIEKIKELVINLSAQNISPVVLLVAQELRKPLSVKMKQFLVSGIVVVSHAEIDAKMAYEIIGTLKLDNTF